MKKEEIYEAIGKTLAPVEIDSDEALEMFGITKKDLVPIMVGRKRILIYPYPAPEEICREMLNELRRRYQKESRINRCLIPGANGKLRACPWNRSCSDCTLDHEQKILSHVSLEFLLDEGVEVEIASPDCLSVVDVNLFLERLTEINPVYAEIVKLRGVGYTEPEISQMLHVPVHAVKYARKKIREFAVIYFGISEQ